MIDDTMRASRRTRKTLCACDREVAALLPDGQRDNRSTTWSAGAAANGRSHQPRVATLVAPTERDRVAVAGFGTFQTIHRDSILAVREDLRSDRIVAAIVSVAPMQAEHHQQLGQLVRDFPGRPVIGLILDSDDAQAIPNALVLGRVGIDIVIDARVPSGWGRLRSVFSSRIMMESFRPNVLVRIQSEVGSIPESCRRFFELLFDPEMTRAKHIAARLGVGTSTLNSRFYRASLPSARRYLDFARLVRSAYFGREPGLSGGDIANHLDVSSPQSLGRMVKRLTGLTFSCFRYRYDGAAVLDRFVRELVMPNAGKLRAFDPGRPTSRR